jgi:hypothetical protein
VRQRPQVQVVCVETARPGAARPLDFCPPDPGLEDADDVVGKTVLKIKHVGQVALEAIGPHVRSGGGIDQLARDAHPPIRTLNAAFQHIPNAQVAANLADVDRAPLVCERGLAGDDDKRLEASQRRENVVDHSVSEVVLTGVAGEIGEGQNGN